MSEGAAEHFTGSIVVLFYECWSIVKLFNQIVHKPENIPRIQRLEMLRPGERSKRIQG